MPLAKRTTSSDHCRMSWAWADGLRVPAEDAERPVTHLVAVAVGAVQEVASPPLAHPGDVRQLVAQAGGHQHPTCGHAAAALRRDVESRCVVVAGPDGGHGAGDDLPAVGLDLCAALGQEFGRRHPVTRQEALHVRGRCVARLARIDHDDARRARVRTRAAESPAAPPPMTATSNRCPYRRRSQGHGRWGSRSCPRESPPRVEATTVVAVSGNRA